MTIGNFLVSFMIYQLVINHKREINEEYNTYY